MVGHIGRIWRKLLDNWRWTILANRISPISTESWVKIHLTRRRVSFKEELNRYPCKSCLQPRWDPIKNRKIQFGSHTFECIYVRREHIGCLFTYTPIHGASGGYVNILRVLPPNTPDQHSTRRHSGKMPMISGLLNSMNRIICWNALRLTRVYKLRDTHTRKVHSFVGIHEKYPNGIGMCRLGRLPVRRARFSGALQVALAATAVNTRMINGLLAIVHEIPKTIILFRVLFGCPTICDTAIYRMLIFHIF